MNWDFGFDRRVRAVSGILFLGGGHSVEFRSVPEVFGVGDGGLGFVTFNNWK
ncbi:hypothetical protein [Pedosphaera parvula]|uniref:hypothetical protein n=1 Tax=Pedosphaera parvula TaxID=1032527 RepID=UPI0002EAB125|nr:hypothetical protein [Pedosphaera parvula]